MNGFIKPLQDLLTPRTIERQIAPGVRLQVRPCRASIVQGMAHRIHEAWDSFRKPQQPIDLEGYLDRVERRAA